MKKLNKGEKIGIIFIILVAISMVANEYVNAETEIPLLVGYEANPYNKNPDSIIFHFPFQIKEEAWEAIESDIEAIHLIEYANVRRHHVFVKHAKMATQFAVEVYLTSYFRVAFNTRGIRLVDVTQYTHTELDQLIIDHYSK